MGQPFRRRGSENLRIEVVGDELHVLWRLGVAAVAHLVASDDRVARGLYEWLSERLGTGAGRLAAAQPDPAVPERVVHGTRWRRPARRQLAVLSRGERCWKVVDVVGGTVRSAAHVADEDEAARLFELLADPRRAAALAGYDGGPRRRGSVKRRPRRAPAPRGAPGRAPASRC